jgi:hypothetical protein
MMFFMARIVLPFGHFVLLILLLSASACDPMPKRPEKQFGVPSTAAWAFQAGTTSADRPARGVWVDCWRTEEAVDRFDCTIYSPDAKPQAKGRYALLGGDPKQPISYRTWDGKVLTLDGGRTMVPEPRREVVQPP